jgi:hypothetical protein
VVIIADTFEHRGMCRQDSTSVTAADVQAFAGEQARTAAAAAKVRTDNLFNKSSWDE